MKTEVFSQIMDVGKVETVFRWRFDGSDVTQLVLKSLGNVRVASEVAYEVGFDGNAFFTPPGGAVVLTTLDAISTITDVPYLYHQLRVKTPESSSMMILAEAYHTSKE